MKRMSSAVFFLLLVAGCDAQTAVCDPGGTSDLGAPADLAATPTPDAGLGAPLITSFTPSPVPVGEDVWILGRHYEIYAPASTVLIDGFATRPLFGSDTQRLFVTVPGHIVVPAGQTREVTVQVITPQGAATATLTVSASLGGYRPEVRFIAAPSGITLEGEAIELFGTGFAATAAQNQVAFDGIAATVLTVDATRNNSLRVEVPRGIPGTHAGKIIGVTVRVGGRESTPSPVLVQQ